MVALSGPIPRAPALPGDTYLVRSTLKPKAIHPGNATVYPVSDICRGGKRLHLQGDECAGYSGSVRDLYADDLHSAFVLSGDDAAISIAVVDTAGFRLPAALNDAIEFYSNEYVRENVLSADSVKFES